MLCMGSVLGEPVRPVHATTTLNIRMDRKKQICRIERFINQRVDLLNKKRFSWVMSFVLEARGVSKHFKSADKRIDVLESVDFQINAGESISIQGASGSGKSTFLNILGQLELPDSGCVLWGDEDTSKISDKHRSRLRSQYMGFVYQHYYLIPELDVLENVLIPCRIIGQNGSKQTERALHLLERVGLVERKNQVTNQLSGGERQRVALARALINEPKLVLADEPTGNLDEETGIIVMNMLLELCEQENTALVLVTHNQYFASRTSGSKILSHGQFL